MTSVWGLPGPGFSPATARSTTCSPPFGLAVPLVEGEMPFPFGDMLNMVGV